MNVRTDMNVRLKIESVKIKCVGHASGHTDGTDNTFHSQSGGRAAGRACAPHERRQSNGQGCGNIWQKVAGIYYVEGYCKH